MGAKRIRAGDPDWPRPGATFHHTVGAWPLTIGDSTSVVDSDSPARSAAVPGDGHLVLHARAMPAGVAEVSLEVLEEGGGSGHHSTVVMTERPIAGWGARLHNPLLDAAVHLRNAISLRPLKDLVEREEAGSGH